MGAEARRGFPHFVDTSVSPSERLSVVSDAIFGERSGSAAAAAGSAAAPECGWWDWLVTGCSSSPVEFVPPAANSETGTPVSSRAAGGTASSASRFGDYYVTESVIERVVVRDEGTSATRALLERLGVLEAQVARFDGRIDAINSYSPKSARRSRAADREDTSASIASAVSGGSSDASFGSLVVSGSATSTFANGLDISDGCFAVDGVCLSAAGGADGTFSTTSAVYWDTTVARWATTSSDYWESTQTRWATTSSAHWLTTKTTADLAESGSLYYTDARVGAYVSASSTIPHVGGSAYGDVLYWTGSAWSKMATSTLGIDGSKWDDAAGGISYSGGNVGIGTVSPTEDLQVDGVVRIQGAEDAGILAFGDAGSGTGYYNTGVYRGTLGSVAAGGNYLNLGSWGGIAFNTGNASLGSQTPRLVIEDGTGNVGVGTTTPGSLLSLGALANFTTATSTFYSTGGINLAGGCFAVGGVCVGGGGSSQWTTSGSDLYYATGNVGIGTTTAPTATLSLYDAAGTASIDFTSASGGLFTLGTDGDDNSNFKISAPSFGGNDVFVIASNVISTSYANPGGTGNRSSLITVTDSGGILHSSDHLVNGSTVANGEWFILGAVSGSNWIKFDFGVGHTKVIQEATYTQQTSATQGVWQWQGSNDDGSWTNIGSSFTLGGSTSDVITELSGNTFGYRYYRMLGVSGSTNAGPLVYQMDFKITESTGGLPYVGINDVDPSAALDVTGWGSGTGYTFRTQNSSSVTSLIVLDNGNVGVGTTTPYAKLSVAGQIVGSHFTATTTATSTFGGPLQFSAYSSTPQLVSPDGNTGVHFDSAGQISLHNSGAQSVLIDSTGRFGVGTSTPSAKLAVTGSGAGTGRAFVVANSSNADKFVVDDGGSLVLAGSVTSQAGLNLHAGLHSNIVLATTLGNLSVTNGGYLRGVSGSVSSPLYSFTGDTDSGMYSVSADKLSLVTGGADRLIIDSSGNVGVGTSTPGAKLHVLGTTEQLRLGYDATKYSSFTTGSTGGLTIASGGTGQNLTLSPSAGGGIVLIGGDYKEIGSSSNTALVLDFGSDLANAVTFLGSGGRSTVIGVAAVGVRVRSDHGYNFSSNTDTRSSSDTGIYRIAAATVAIGNGTAANTSGTLVAGNVGVGTTTPYAKLSVHAYANAANANTLFAVASSTPSATTTLLSLSSAGSLNLFALQGGATNVTVDANGNLIRDPSDANLKENVEAVASAEALEKVLLLRGVTFDWRDQEKYGPQRELGFIAQEVQAVIPEAVSAGGDYLSLSVKPIVAALVGAVQEVWAKVESLAAAVDSMAAWFSDDGSRIEVQGDVCVDGVCVTPDQFKQILIGGGATVPEETPEPEPTPEPVGEGGGGDGADAVPGEETPADVPDEGAEGGPADGGELDVPESPAAAEDGDGDEPSGAGDPESSGGEEHSGGDAPVSSGDGSAAE